MATLHNQFAQTVLGLLLRPHGFVQTEVTLDPAEPQRADVLFIPTENTSHADALPLGDLGRMLTTPALLEPFSDAPRIDEVLALIRKILTVNHVAGGADTVAPFDALTSAVLWVLCAERPTRVINEARCYPLPAWGPGYYALSPILPVRIVVLGELANHEDTLFLRILGTVATQQKLVEPLRTRAARDPRFLQILKAMVEYLRRRKRRPQEKDNTMWDLSETERWIEEQVNLGLQQGMQQGMQRGRQEGRLEALVHPFERRLRRPLSETERTTLLTRIDTLGTNRVTDVLLDTTTPEALEAWLADPDAR